MALYICSYIMCVCGNAVGESEAHYVAGVKWKGWMCVKCERHDGPCV